MLATSTPAFRSFLCRNSCRIPVAFLVPALFFFRHFSTNLASNDRYEDLFKFTSGRWIHNEKKELEKSYHRLNVDALKRIAASSAGANSVSDIKKLTESEFHKDFLLSLDNGKEVIARLPLPNAAPPYLIAANQVASMDFARTRLHIPTPHVLAWSSDVSENAVESDFLITEKPEGIELGTIWNAMDSDMKRRVAQKIVEVEKSYMAALDGGFGAVYRRGDVESSIAFDLTVDCVRDDEFVLGPVTSPSFWNEERADMEVNRGPWETPLDYIFSVVNRERSWIYYHTAANEYPSPFDAPPSKRHPDAHVAALEMLIKVAPYLVPSDPVLTRPTLCHPYLDLEHVFISKDRLDRGEIEITSITDWQHASVLPLYIAARVPPFLRREGVPPLPIDPPPRIPNPNERRQNVVYDESADRLYTSLSRVSNPLYHKALHFTERDVLLAPFAYGSITWPDHLVAFREALLNLTDQWPSLYPDTPCPISFTDEERSNRHADRIEWERYRAMARGVDAQVGVESGRVSAEGYDAALARNKAYMDAYIHELEQEMPEQAAMAKSVVPTFWIYRPWDS
ncbi:hypothetical protein NLJ89_g2868 [Agrocybe chaxingu]|uniref:Aminoglycoside phosphotransferase domain-containing protein n=1 Tax=Agrocybe chaxingu TaxID=84603 RepID=A0A9W8K601_9AGAR|nr:hypothetical protein NLJ89_g2868 [Agrocybe chaxingu]